MFFKYGDDFDNQYNLQTNEKVCSHHISNNYIEKYIVANGEPGKCSYCGKKLKVVELNVLLELLIAGLNYLYENPANSRFLNKDGKHGFDGKTFDFYDIWYEDYLGLMIDDAQLFKDIYKYLENDELYCEKDEFGSEQDYWNDIWKHFQKTVKHRARFVFYYKKAFSNYLYKDPITILNQVQTYVTKFNLISELNVDSKLYRCRQHRSRKEVAEKKDLASPPDHLTKINGRMNPAGISMFYCSVDKGLTIQEVVDFSDLSRPLYSVGFFKNKQKLKLVDLTKLPDVPSIFDKSNNKHIESIRFLQGFIADISKPISSSDTIIEYIPTQIVTEYIKYNPKLNVDGIIYPSSKKAGSNNIVLFYDHEESMEYLDFQKTKIRTIKI